MTYTPLAQKEKYMADWSLPTVGSKYVDYTAQLNSRLNDLAYGLDPAITSASNTLTNFQRWNSANARWEKYNGSSWVALASSYAIDITGKAASLSTARAIALSGDATGTANFDGSAGISIATTLANSGVSAGSYGSATAIPAITVDAKGRVTAAGTNTVTPAWSSITSKPTTLSGYGITDAISNAGSTPSVQAGTFAARPAAATVGRLYLATDTMTLYRDTGSAWDLVLPAFTGDVTKAMGGTALTLAASGVTAGSYIKVTVDAKGRVTAGSSLLGSDVTTALGFTPYDATNPDGYITSSALSSYLPKAGGAMTGTLSVTVTGAVNAVTGISSGANNWGGYFKNTDNTGNVEFKAGGSAAADRIFAGANDGVEKIYCDTSGNFTALGDVTAFSDERNKTDWRDLPADFIDLLAGVKHGTYKRTDDDLIQVGVSAQSLRPVMPQAVHQNSEGMLSVAYGNAALTACVQLAQAVVALRAEVAALKA